MTYGLDTSVILRIITGEPSALAQAVDIRIAEMVANGDTMVISALPASEAYYSLQHFYGRTKQEAIMALRALADEEGFSFLEGQSGICGPHDRERLCRQRSSHSILREGLPQARPYRGHFLIRTDSSRSVIDENCSSSLLPDSPIHHPAFAIDPREGF